MNALLFLIPVSLVLVGVGVGIFFWAMRHHQFDDLDTPEVLPLLEDDGGAAPADSAGPADADHGDPGASTRR